ncbi:hypothetical protein [Mesorhizobium sp. M0058]|uniref:hypothetical protein n=1 Tax=Mesorhizobium sp. M0058 TaxID=2956865 RepID=UPI00333B9B62
MKVIISSIALLVLASGTAFADTSKYTEGDWGQVWVDKMQTPTTDTTRVSTGGRIYGYGQNTKFQPEPIGDTNPHNTTNSTSTAGVGVSFP